MASWVPSGPLLSAPLTCSVLQIVTSASTDLQDYTYYFVPAPWLSVKLLRLLQCYPPPGDGQWGRGSWPTQICTGRV